MSTLHHLSFALVQRYATSRRGFTAVVSSFALVGITLGVGALIVVMCVMAGFRAELLDKILGVSGHGTVFVNHYSNEEVTLTEAILRENTNITQVTPYLQGQVLALNNGQTAGAILRGMDVQNLPALLVEHTTELERDLFTKPNTVAMGQRMARSLGVGVGDGVTLLSSEGAHTPFGFVPRIVQARVAFVFETGSALYDQGLVLTNLPFTRQILRTQQTASALEIRVSEPAEITTVKASIRADLLAATPDIPLQFQTWQDTNQAFFQALQTERVVMFIILSLIVLVAVFNIITGQIMLVMDKTPDIAILRTLGATRARILRVFLLNGFLLGALGTLLGLAVGMAIVLNLQGITAFVEGLTGTSLFSGDVYPIDAIPSRIVWPDIFAVLAMSFTLTLLASLYPAWRAARMNPVEGLK